MTTQAMAVISFDRCASIGALRATEPAQPGQRIDLKEYSQGTGYGGGYFIHQENDTTSPDDGGYCIVTPKGARWKRALNSLHELNVCHFGAVGGGKVDTADAFAKMMAWSQANIPAIGVQYPAGMFKLSKFTNTKEIARFRVAGAPVNSDFGYFNTTTLIGDNTEEGFILDIVARRTSIAHINFEGAADPFAANDKKVAGLKGFLRNTCPGGQYVRVSNWASSFVGGVTFSILDALDTKFDQFYVSKHTNSFIYGRWSGQTWGVWDHETAIELSNFNVQNCTGPHVFDLPRATQSEINNGWIEHTTNPGNLSDGHWLISNFSMEGCGPMLIENARLTRHHINLQAGSSWDKSTGNSNWTGLSGYEKGDLQLEWHGIDVAGSMTASYYSPEFRLDNNKGSSQWFYLGNIRTTGVGENVKITLQGTRGYNSVKGDATQHGGAAQAHGAAVISIKTVSSNYVDLEWDGEGACPVKNVKFTKPFKNSCHVFVELFDWTRYVSPFVQVTSKSRFEAGIPFDVVYDGRALTLAEIQAIVDTQSAAAGSTIELLDGVTGMCFGAKNGIGWNGQGDLLLRFALKDGYLPVKITDPVTERVTQGYIKVETSIPAK
ncbi:putative EPS depolymerase [Erwinia phage vB_EamM_Stratton]|uniref:Putative EPS depolymerase n=1 Tax=Erwinia phage vB_EamM_Stratton TaxID=1883378 RepID=A0A1B2IH28_9CAUD|nr:putative EPS depolymerase [Erwinia phage vB_EamM_Stratton]